MNDRSEGILAAVGGLNTLADVLDRHDGELDCRVTCLPLHNPVRIWG